MGRPSKAGEGFEPQGPHYEALGWYGAPGIEHAIETIEEPTGGFRTWCGVRFTSELWPGVTKTPRHMGYRCQNCLRRMYPRARKFPIGIRTSTRKLHTDQRVTIYGWLADKGLRHLVISVDRGTLRNACGAGKPGLNDNILIERCAVCMRTRAYQWNKVKILDHQFRKDGPLNL